MEQDLEMGADLDLNMVSEDLREEGRQAGLVKVANSSTEEAPMVPRGSRNIRSNIPIIREVNMVEVPSKELGAAIIIHVRSHLKFSTGIIDFRCLNYEHIRSAHIYPYLCINAGIKSKSCER